MGNIIPLLVLLLVLSAKRWLHHSHTTRGVLLFATFVVKRK